MMMTTNRKTPATWFGIRDANLICPLSLFLFRILSFQHICMLGSIKRHWRMIHFNNLQWTSMHTKLNQSNITPAKTFLMEWQPHFLSLQLFYQHLAYNGCLTFINILHVSSKWHILLLSLESWMNFHIGFNLSSDRIWCRCSSIMQMESVCLWVFGQIS